jgi:hypothetical protein
MTDTGPALSPSATITAIRQVLLGGLILYTFFVFWMARIVVEDRAGHLDTP